MHWRILVDFRIVHMQTLGVCWIAEWELHRIHMRGYRLTVTVFLEKHVDLVLYPYIHRVRVKLKLDISPQPCICIRSYRHTKYRQANTYTARLVLYSFTHATKQTNQKHPYITLLMKNIHWTFSSIRSAPSNWYSILVSYFRLAII